MFEGPAEGGGKPAPCGGTGSLYKCRDCVVTIKHVFEDSNNVFHDPLGFSFYVKVRLPSGKYDFREYKVTGVRYEKNKSPDETPKDGLVYLQLNEKVSEVVDGVKINRKYWIEPLNEGPGLVDQSKESVGGDIYNGGYALEEVDNGKGGKRKDYIARRSCHPISVTRGPIEDLAGVDRSWVFHNGSSKPMYSGGPLVSFQANGRGGLNGGLGGVHKGAVVDMPYNLAIDLPSVLRESQNLFSSFPRLATK